MDIMFDPYIILKFFHIIMAGLWLGMDMGVYNCGMKVRDPSLSIETRAAMAKVSGFLDMGPRSAVIILLMLGITMTSLGGWGFQGGYGPDLAIAAALIGIVWLSGLWHQYWVDHPNLGEARPEAHVKFQTVFRKWDIRMRVVVTGILLFTAIWSLTGDGPIVATWLAVKLVLFSVIVSCGIGIRIYIPQARAAIADIFANGSTPEREAAAKVNRGKALFFVKSIWTLVAIVIWVSVAKF
ncbi:MAG: hypothetical protein OSB02_12650 [Rhodospirillaceae bacterium]|jgi:hypothetical protein|nr:hypothetical protein [Rhodospirillaceae bacterium]